MDRLLHDIGSGRRLEEWKAFLRIRNEEMRNEYSSMKKKQQFESEAKRGEAWGADLPWKRVK